MRKRCSSWLSRPALVLGLGLVLSQAAAQRAIAPLESDEPIGYFITDNRTNGDAPGADAELCAWALDDWVRHSAGRLRTLPADESEAVVRIYFISPGAGRYGEMRPIRVGGRRGAEVFVTTGTEALGPDIAGAVRSDPLLRETIVYLTCLHEIGHALGMVHTDRFEDVMYFFGFGGDIVGFFTRYRSRLETRTDIARVSGLSGGDIAQLLAAYPDE